MRLLVSLLALAMAIAAAAPTDAREKRDRHRKVLTERQETRAYRRSSTVGPNGACQRDTGRPSQNLDLNHPCDREEFWARFNDTGGDSRN